MEKLEYLDIEELIEKRDFAYKELEQFIPSSDVAVIVMFELGQLGIGCWDSHKKKFHNVNDPFEQNVDDKWLWTYSRVDRWKPIA